MLSIIILSFIPILIMSILIFINFMFSKKKYYDFEKSSPFECGFNPLNPTNYSMSNQFIIISMIFLIFDIEFIVLITIIPMMNYNSLWFFSFFSIMIILFIGLFYEYNFNTLIWLK
uniref:NADH-ubiquinone oxidoreductase chain 3 n=1 Tax=Allorhynchium sp. GX TaxID=2742723 RepID=A0A6M9AX04_9HYME|nr:NADH dehydrogenase subunit 3 [Allorhynchium sp. GX]QKK69200.1 NADH dehydrogenase subunit 3 [Allorhynchium sp. GX]